MTRCFLVGLAVVLSFQSAHSAEKILQILHTNDLHSYWEHASRKNVGGFARIKTLLDTLQNDGNRRGWVTLRLDAGDFSEGNINFYANGGRSSFAIMKAMNYDAIALGNHDFLTGAEDLTARQFDPAQQLPLVSANFRSPLGWNPAPGMVFQRGGLKIAVGGATTDEDTYSWMATPATISNPFWPLRNWLKAQTDADVRIALTHIGFTRDLVLAGTIKEVDVIVGGHTHTTLENIYYGPSIWAKSVPIVQTGAHGASVGRLVLKVVTGKPIQVVSYQLVKVTPSLMEDVQVKALIDQGVAALQTQFPRRLDTVIAHSEKDYFLHKVKAPVAGNIFADAMKEYVGADVALDSGKLYNEMIEAGPITYRDILNLAPHFYDWKTEGWRIYTCPATAREIVTMLNIMHVFSKSVFVSGIKANINLLRGTTSIKINDQEPDHQRTYKVAFSEGLIKGVKAQAWLNRLLCQPIEDTGKKVRDALFQKLFVSGTIGPQILGEPRLIGTTTDEHQK